MTICCCLDCSPARIIISASTYTVFGNIATQQYPELFKDANKIPDVKENSRHFLCSRSVFDALAERAAEADVASFSSSG